MCKKSVLRYSREKKKAFPDNKNNEFKRVEKLAFFANWLVLGFGQEIDNFPSFYFRQN